MKVAPFSLIRVKSLLGSVGNGAFFYRSPLPDRRRFSPIARLTDPGHAATPHLPCICTPTCPPRVRLPAGSAVAAARGATGAAAAFVGAVAIRGVTAAAHSLIVRNL